MEESRPQKAEGIPQTAEINAEQRLKVWVISTETERETEARELHH
jgi:hypothetical protein